MANFDELIRQALAKQDSGDPGVRERVYRSSRAALARMIERKGNVTPEVVQRQEEILELSIQKIESEFADSKSENPAPIVPPAPPVPPPVKNIMARQELPPETTAPDISVQADEARQHSVAPEPVSHTPEPVDVDEQGDISSLEPDFTARHKTRRRVIKFVGFLGFLAIIALVAYVGYLLVLALIDKNSNADPQNREVSRVSELNPVDGQGGNPSQYLTLLEPNDPSSIVVDGAGQAEIVNDVETTVLRIVSVRSAGDSSEPAKPILLEILPGVLSQINGKNTTVEILAKSGSSGPATFSVECQFGDIGSCGRKRFRVGLQPEAVVFSIEVKGESPNKKAYLALRTDIASSANLSGRGDTLDIISARLRIVGEN